jgi:Tannase and feruloyl esterase
MRRWVVGAGVLCAVCAVTLVSVSAQNSSQFRDWNPSVLAGSTTTAPKMACAALVSLTGYEISISAAVNVPASSEGPEYCRVVGLIQPEIRFELSLPAAWNGRLYMFGNGGYAGEALDQAGRVAAARRAVARGFAAAQTNTGHDAAAEPLGTFAASPQKLVDYAYRSVHVTALTAKKIAEAYYGGAVRHSYFDGCSTGGRQGLISAQRFPDDFDGIVAGAPVLDFAGTMIGYAAMQRALKAAPIEVAKMKLVADAVYAKCDAIDGVRDGVIDDPRRCPFNPSADLPHCEADADGPACFTSGQLRSLDAVYAPVTRQGAEFFPGWPVGAEIGIERGLPTGWVPFFIAPPNRRPVGYDFGETFFKNIAFGRPNPSYDWLSFDVDKDLEKLQAARSLLDATDPDLVRFKARGGKMVSYFGWADNALNPLMGVKYYERVMNTMGPATQDFYRLFMVPGMFHCGGGVGASTFDALTPLVGWVEHGTAPDSLRASRIVDGKTTRTRPLCAYPLVAKYSGTGSIDDAANFTCALAARAPASRP